MTSMIDPAILDVVGGAGQDPAFNRARSLVEAVRTGARAWLELGEVLEKLHEQFFKVGSGRRTDLQPSPHGAAKVSELASDRGWQAKVREELGISDDTARRWILDARRYRQLLQITSGDLREIEGNKITAAVRKEAEIVLTEIAADPTVRPARKWAGLWGAGATRGTQRAAVDHARNLERGLKALANSLEHWNELPADSRIRIEAGWAELAESGLIPSTWRRRP